LTLGDMLNVGMHLVFGRLLWPSLRCFDAATIAASTTCPPVARWSRCFSSRSKAKNSATNAPASLSFSRNNWIGLVSGVDAPRSKPRNRSQLSLARIRYPIRLSKRQ
jgi:hypothetical protein